MKKILKGVRHSVSILLFILLICMTVAVIATQTAGKGGPELFGYHFKTVLSGSMEPDIPTGSVIGIQTSNDSDDYEEGDIITYRHDDIFITHRIIEVKQGGNQYITKGDNNNTPDPDPVLKQQIVGVHSGLTVPYVGYATHFANSSGGRALLFIIPGFVLLGYAIYTIWRSLTDKKHEA